MMNKPETAHIAEQRDVPPVSSMIMEFINSKSFIRSKVVNNKAYCDKCKLPFPAILPMFVKIDESNEELLCYPCNYKRLGIDVKEMYRKKRGGNEIQSMKQQKMEQSKAYQIANDILAELAPFCTRAFIAGSLRRLKPDPKDIEIIVSPKVIETQDGFFDTKKVRIPDFISKVNSLGKILKGSPTDGRYVNIELGGELKLDLFIPQESDFIRQYVLRTGSANFAKNNIASSWRRLGWCGTEDGLRLMVECEKKGEDKWVCIVDSPTLHPAWKTEEDLFRWLNIEFVKPENRN